MGGYGSGFRYGPRRRRTHELPSVRASCFRGRRGLPLEGDATLSVTGAGTFRVWVTTTPQPFGGHRYWFRCPRCSRRCAVLYLRADLPGCRRCLGLSYRSQNIAPHQRMMAQAAKLRDRVSYEDERGWHMPKKGVRRKTFDRVMDRAEEYDELAAHHALAGLERIFQRAGL